MRFWQSATPESLVLLSLNFSRAVTNSKASSLLVIPTEAAGAGAFGGGLEENCGFDFWKTVCLSSFSLNLRSFSVLLVLLPASFRCCHYWSMGSLSPISYEKSGQSIQCLIYRALKPDSRFKSYSIKGVSIITKWESYQGKDNLALYNISSISQVFKVHDTQQKQYFAAKYLSSQKLNEHGGLVRDLALNEIKALNLVKNENCPYIVKLFAHYESSQGDLILLLEYCDSGDLESLLRQRTRFSEADGVGIIKQIFGGLACLHKHLIIHRDMKAANILVHQNKIFKIADLGFCAILDNAQSKVHLPLGSLGTMAPEIVLRQRYGLQVDIFALGAIFYQLIHARLPFNCDSQSAFLDDINKRDGTIQNQVDPEGRVSVSCLELISQMLRRNPDDRITFVDLAKHPILKKYTNEQFMRQGISLIQHQGNQLDLVAHQDFYIQNSNRLCLSDSQSPSKKIRILHVVEEIPFTNLFQWVRVEPQSNSVNRLYNVFNALVYMERTLHEFTQINHKTVLAAIYPQYLLSKKLLLESQYLVVELWIVKERILLFKQGTDRQIDELDKLMKELRDRHINLYSTYFIREVMDNPDAIKYASKEWQQEVSERPTHQFEQNYKDGILTMINSTQLIVDGPLDVQQQQMALALCFIIHLYKILDFTNLAQNPPNIYEDFDLLPSKPTAFLLALLNQIRNR